MLQFGSGKLIAVPTNDSTGAAIAVPTPVVLGTLQEVGVDLSVDLAELYGNKRYPVAVAQGKGKTEIKAKYADINGGVLGSLFAGKASTAGIKGAVMDFAASVPASTPYTVTVAPPNSGTFVADLGVLINGVAATRVASAPTAGQYSVSAGVYTFAAADSGKALLLSYEYSATSTTGQIYTLTNDVMGPTPSFTMLLQTSYDGKTLAMKLSRCVSSKLNLPFKNSDFGVFDFEAKAFEDAATNSLGWICLF